MSALYAMYVYVYVCVRVYVCLCVCVCVCVCVCDCVCVVWVCRVRVGAYKNMLPCKANSVIKSMYFFLFFFFFLGGRGRSLSLSLSLTHSHKHTHTHTHTNTNHSVTYPIKITFQTYSWHILQVTLISIQNQMQYNIFLNLFDLYLSRHILRQYMDYINMKAYCVIRGKQLPPKHICFHLQLLPRSNHSTVSCHLFFAKLMIIIIIKKKKSADWFKWWYQSVIL